MSTYIKHKRPDKFFLMENCPEKPNHDRGSSPSGVDYEIIDELNDLHEQALQSIPAIEIINPEVLNALQCFYIQRGEHGFAEVNGADLKDNEIFILSDTVGYKIVCNADCPDADHGNCCHPKSCAELKRARLYVKAEKGETQEYDSEDHLWAAVHTEFLYVGTEGIWSVIDRLKSKYTITRKP